jgi:DNA primase
VAGKIREEDVTSVRERARIDEIVRETVTLKAAGGGSYKGLCPFHDERSPSFHVTPSKGFFHCFGCQASGDVIAFLMKIDHLSFTETIERLADRMGYQLRYEQGNFTPAPAGNRSRLIAANALAAKFYQEQLNTSPLAAHARELMTKRGFDKGACETFGVGYAPDEWDGLTKYLREQGLTIDEIETAVISKM